MVEQDRLDYGGEIHQKAAHDGKFMRADGDHGVEADAQCVVEIFFAAVFVGH